MMSKHYTLRAGVVLRSAEKSKQYKALNFITGERFNINPFLYWCIVDYLKGRIDLEKDDFLIPYFEHLCKIGILERKENKGKLSQFDIINYRGHLVETILWHITDACNCNCRHCYLKTRKVNHPFDLEMDKVEYILGQMSEVGVLSLNLSGGEVGLINNLDEILNRIHKRKIHIEGIFSNGTLVNQIETINKFPQKITVYVSIDGASSKTHDDFRRAPGSFDKAISLSSALDRKKHRLAINSIIHKNNVEEIDDFFNLIMDIHPSGWRVETPFPSEKWSANKDYFVPVDLLIKVYKKILEKWLAAGEPFDLELGQLFRSRAKFLGERRFSLGDGVCSYYEGMFGLNPDGTVLHCPALDVSMSSGNIFEKKLSEIIESEHMRFLKTLSLSDLIMKNEEFNRCKTCPYLHICGLGCRANVYNLTRNYFGFDTFTCEQIKKGIPVLRDVLKGTEYEQYML